MARGVDAGTGKKAGTMCVHAAHVACQPAWQPGGLPSASSSSLASKSETLSLFPPLFLSLPRSLSLFFLFFQRKSGATREEGYLPFYQTAASYLEHSHPRPTCGWMGITTGERLPRTLAATLKPYRATRFSCVTIEGLTD